MFSSFLGVLDVRARAKKIFIAFCSDKEVEEWKKLKAPNFTHSELWMNGFNSDVFF